MYTADQWTWNRVLRTSERQNEAYVKRSPEKVFRKASHFSRLQVKGKSNRKNPTKKWVLKRFKAPRCKWCLLPELVSDFQSFKMDIFYSCMPVKICEHAPFSIFWTSRKSKQQFHSLCCWNIFLCFKAPECRRQRASCIWPTRISSRSDKPSSSAICRAFSTSSPTNNFPTAARMISPFGGGAVEVTVWNKRFKMDFGNEERR